MAINSSVLNSTMLNAGGEAAGAYDLIAETAPITSSISSSIIPNVAESMVGTDAVSDIHIITEQAETASITNSFDILRTAKPEVVEDGDISATAAVRRIVTVDVDDEAPVTSTATEGPPPDDLVETAPIASSMDWLRTTGVDFSDSLIGLSSTTEASRVDLSEEAPIESAITSNFTARADVAEEAPITSTISDGAEYQNDLIAAAQISSTIDSLVTAGIDVTEEAFIYAEAYSTDGTDGSSGLPLDAVWTADLSSWGMSRYSGVAMSNRGKRFAVSEGGLYEIGTGYADGRISTGFLNFGTSQKKRLLAVYVRGTHDTAPSVEVTSERRGARQTYSYTPLADDASDPSVVRADVGRGLTGPYYRVALDTTGRSEVFSCDAAVSATQRRV